MPPSHAQPTSALRGLLESKGLPYIVRRFASHAVVFSQGDPCDSVLHIETGRVWLAVTTATGKEAISGVLGPDAFLGEEVLGGHAVRLQTAVAMTPSEILVIPRAQMAHLLHTQQAVLDHFVAYLTSYHGRLEQNLSDQLLHSSEERLAYTLMGLAGCNGQRACGCQLPQVSQEILAEMVGTTRARVNALLGKFKRLGFVERDRDGLLIRPSMRRAEPISGDGHP